MADDPKPGEAVQSPAADFSQILEQAEGLATQAQSLSLAEIVAKRHAEDRGWIAKWIVGAFLTARNCIPDHFLSSMARSL